MAQNGGAGKFCGAVPFGDREAALGVGVVAGAGIGVEAGELVVMAAQSLGDLAQRNGALGAGLALPEENEALAAYGTTQIRGIRGAFAQNLHGDSCLSSRRYSGCNGKH
jgi:hypothetical protein